MTFLETLLLLLVAAILLLQVSRRLALPYPSMLAVAGMVVALVPGAPVIPIDPVTALALFIAPALMDAAFDFPIGIARRFWAPLLVFAVGGVIVTALCVAFAGWAWAGLPFAAALVLGAIVAPPDAAAATAILSAVAIPRTTDTVLRGESLFNDASALLLFSAALAVQTAGGLTPTVALNVGLAVPGGILLGLATAWVVARINRFVAGTLGGNLLQFVNTILLWIVAERLGLSAVLAIVAFAMAIARDGSTGASARMRVHSYAVWSAVVFVLNVMAFLLMGMQARQILAGLSGPHLRDAMLFAGIVVGIVVAVRIALAIGFNLVMRWYWHRRGEPRRATIQQAILAGWSGMRGLVTLAAAFALPAGFPHRDVVVLAAFAVVIATLVVQGLTLAPLIRLLGLDRRADGESELVTIRAELAGAALSSLDDQHDEAAAALRRAFEIEHRALSDPNGVAALDRYRELALVAVAAQRRALEVIRAEHRVNVDEYNRLLEEIDWRELTALPEDGRRIEES